MDQGPILLIPLHGASADITLSMAREVGPQRIILCHRWRETGEAGRNALALADYFQEKVDDLSRIEKNPHKVGNIKPHTKVRVHALEWYTSMEGLATVFANYIATQYTEYESEIHLAILDDMPMGYLIGAFYAGLTVPLTVWTGDLGRDIRNKHPSKYNPGDSIRQTLTQISQLREISVGLAWSNRASRSAGTLRIAKRIADRDGDEWFKINQIVEEDRRTIGPSAITNHMTRLIDEGYCERQPGRKTVYRLTAKGNTLAELVLHSEGDEEE
jgi:DNA-binding MarR family transcriptional regulator